MGCGVCCLLGNLLVDDDNMALWESENGMVTGDRHVLLSKLVAQANEETLKNDVHVMHIGWSLRTGMLVTPDHSDDDKMKPPGLIIPFEMPDGVALTSLNSDEDDVVDSQSDWDKEVEDGINSSDKKIDKTDVVSDA